MTVHEKFNRTLLRIANATSVVRTRNEDDGRMVNNGGSGALELRTVLVVQRLEAVAEKLEKSIA